MPTDQCWGSSTVQPRYSGRWWVDQDGTEWSAFDLWKGGVFHTLESVVECDNRGVRVYRTGDDDILHLVRIPPPEAPEAEKAQFFVEWDEQGQPPGE
jgi:hypothetical protein